MTKVESGWHPSFGFRSSPGDVAAVNPETRLKKGTIKWRQSGNGWKMAPKCGLMTAVKIAK